MSDQKHMTGSSSPSSNSTASCYGDCLATSKRVFEQALSAARTAGYDSADISKRFQYLQDVAGNDKHKEAEILLEHAVALCEGVYGQEHEAVARMLIDLAGLYTRHGNADYAAYLTGWANDILAAHRIEPTHEFFHLFGMDVPEEEPGLGAN
jgi:hypothetical protein